MVLVQAACDAGALRQTDLLLPSAAVPRRTILQGQQLPVTGRPGGGKMGDTPHFFQPDAAFVVVPASNKHLLHFFSKICCKEWLKVKQEGPFGVFLL
ncbi:hypothetical protein [Flaviaesturariibacter terrae]